MIADQRTFPKWEVGSRKWEIGSRKAESLHFPTSHFRLPPWNDFRFPAFFLALAFLSFSCEKEFIPDVPPAPPKIVVEGYIEAGDRPTPPFVLLTRNVPFFAEVDSSDFEDLFVHNAKVTVSDGVRTVALTEFCLDQLTPEQRELASRLLGLPVDSLEYNICAYVDVSGQMTGTEGGSYELKVETDGHILRSSTTIPPLVKLDSLFFRPPAGQPSDTLAQLRCRISDPAGKANFYRYFTQIDGGQMLAGLNSVFEDRLFDGRSFEFPLAKAESGIGDFDPATFGLYRIGDTVTVKWASIDQAHYNFWSTLEFNAANEGPFSSYTRISSNVGGGLGIWGGLAAAYYTLVVAVDP